MLSTALLEVAKFDERRKLTAALGLRHVGGFAHEELTEVQGGQRTAGAAVGGVALRRGAAWRRLLAVSETIVIFAIDWFISCHFSICWRDWFGLKWFFQWNKLHGPSY